MSIHRTKLRYLGLVSLREIRSGNVAIYDNPELCHVQSFNWKDAAIVGPGGKFVTFTNADQTKCREYNTVFFCIELEFMVSERP